MNEVLHCDSLVLRNILDVVMHYLPLRKLLNILLRRVVKYIVPLSNVDASKALTRFYIMVYLLNI